MYGYEACPPSVCRSNIMTCRQSLPQIRCPNQQCHPRIGKCGYYNVGYQGETYTPKAWPADCEVRNGCNNFTGECYDCRRGFFGRTCDDGCSINCFNNACHRVTRHPGYFDVNRSTRCHKSCSDLGLQSYPPCPVCNEPLLNWDRVCSVSCLDGDMASGQCFESAPAYQVPKYLVREGKGSTAIVEWACLIFSLCMFIVAVTLYLLIEVKNKEVNAE